MKPILNIEDIVKLKMDEKLIECIAGKVNYYRFLCFHPRNSNFVILLNHCEEPVRFYYNSLIDRFFTDYTQRDIITYRKEYALKEIKEFEQALSDCVDVEIPFYDDKKIRDMLNKASADIMKWCDKNMVKYNKELKESRSTKKHCEGLRKHIANLERRLLKHILANVILSIISVAAIIALFTLIQN